MTTRGMRSIVRVTPRVLERDWGQEIIVAETEHYLGKLLHYRAGCAGGLQMHVAKRETFHLLSGAAWVEYDDGAGRLIRVAMEPGETFDIPCGAPHRFIAIDNCVVMETSTPHYDDRIRLEELYGVETIGDGPGLPTTRELPS